jgi:ABC-type protease/lipase transport system fused ATPase/permease subunit
LTLFEFQLAFGLLLILILVVLAFYNSRDKKKIFDDEKTLKIINDALEKKGYDNFEVVSIMSMNESNITYVIVNAGYLQIALEVDNNFGKILNTEKIAR